MTSEQAELMQRVRDAAAALADRHYMWIVDAALRHFQEKTAKNEREIMRHERFAAEPPEGYLTLEESREEQIAKLRAANAENRKVLAFLKAASRALAQASAEAFARELRVSGFGAPRRTR